MRQQVSAGLSAGLEDINRGLASSLSRAYEKEIKEVANKLLKKDSASSNYELARLPFWIMPDSNAQKWKFLSYSRTGAPPLDEFISNNLQNRLLSLYEPWKDSLDIFWANSIDSSFVLFLKENSFSVSTRLALHPFFEEGNGRFKGFLGFEISPFYLEQKFFPSFFASYLSGPALERVDGISKEYLHIYVRDESGRKAFDSALLLGGKGASRITLRHELKTPLSGIKLANDGMRLGRLKREEEQKLAIEIIDKESGKLEEKIRRLTNYARLESGRKVYLK